MLQFFWIDSLTESTACRKIRTSIFVDEQGFSPDNEFDAVDASALHLLCQTDGVPIGAARIFPDPDHPGACHVGRICVIKSRRGMGYGAAMLEEICKKAASLGYAAVVLGAQEQARGFYEKCGFTAFGERYFDEGCPHVMMRRSL